MIKNIILVGSGKGGVGKSTVSVNLSIALSQIKKLKIGLLDADIYGPSIPKMLGINEKPSINEKKKIIPYNNHGIKSISIANMIPKDNAIIWRGVMASSAIKQLFNDVDWGEIDYLIVDLPPGTGDIQLSLCQNFSIDGAILVSTPQEISLIDVRKAISMFKKVKVPILGLIQNMSYFEKNNEKNYLFGKDGVSKESKIQNLEMLGEIPIEENISASCENGIPISLDEKNKISKIFQSLSNNFLNTYSKLTKNTVKIES
ncbi:MAG: ATP-binding protein [Rickettsiales bacterium]|nr:ATP-binding protein [Rickettsiales bacterium]